MTLLTFGRIIAVIAMLNIGGGQWLVLQSVAWSGMLIRYSEDASLAEAVAKTFDGQHPCNLCKGIQEAKKQGEQHRNVVVETMSNHLKCTVSLRAPVLYPPVSFWPYSSIAEAALASAAAPLVPPPRNALG
jgi:hypothetical protein